jgi:hypothetical protein
MKKIVILSILLMGIFTGCNSIISKKSPKDIILKTTPMEDTVKVVFIGKAYRVFFQGEAVFLGREYYIIPGEYKLSWEPTGYLSMSVTSSPRNEGNGGASRNMDKRNVKEITIEEDTQIILDGHSAKLIKMEK